MGRAAPGRLCARRSRRLPSRDGRGRCRARGRVRGGERRQLDPLRRRFGAHGVREPRPGGRVIGLVLAAGAGRRLHPLTSDLPKTLLPVDGDRTILDIALENLCSAGVEDAVIVTGVAGHRVKNRKSELERTHGVRLELLVNDRAEEWNNAYSLWLAREVMRDGALLVNGDTVHPPS